MRPWTSKSITLAIIGLIFVAIGTTLSFTGPMIFRSILSRELPLSPDSRSFEIWRDTTDIPVNIEFFFFNWTNPKELKTPGKKPNLVQVGPYAFVEKRQKVNITFHPENNTVSYLQRRTWHFDPDRSNGSLHDKIVQLNVVAVSAAHKIRYWAYFFQNSLSYMLNSLAGIHVVKTVDELLFTGYKDSIIDMGQFAPEDEEIPPYDRFGWFYLRNGSTAFDGLYNMGTGQDDLSNLGMTKNWNYKDTTKYYKSPCNAVEGSAGEFFPPFRNKDEITIFSADMCRPLTYEYVQSVQHQGIPGYRYALGEKSLSNETWRKYPHEQAKYIETTTTTEDFFAVDGRTEASSASDKDPDLINTGHCFCNGECSPMGLINVTACRYGAPGFISLPHFYKADPILRDQVNGLNPNADQHSFYMTLEPTTGIPIDVAARLQVNILLQPSLTIALFKDVPKIYFPMFWFNLRSGTTEELASSLRQLLMLPDIGSYCSAVMVAIGSLMLVIAAALLYLQRTRDSQNIKSRKVAASNGKKTELIYMDVANGDDDANARTDRQLRPKL
ncbi:protein croquemort-like [Venturia canescens]|uniref:protein croquemort-like n=1 Tax=Venturia canescens TaxID=32260 RepID=UPI001C9D2ED9|nr:protein croquemort-like [Venturia canescens]XP_043270802.1 protein croquemort-like [Venturia canescens]